jgi:hypothetical protein
MTTPKRRGKSAAAQDLAEARRRAAAAQRPIARKVTKQVVESKERTDSGEAAKAGARAPRPR